MHEYRSSRSAESFHSTVGVVCVIWCSGLFHAAAGMGVIIAISNRQSAIGLKAQSTQVVAALLGALSWCAVTRKHVLLDHDPAVVSGAGEGAGHRGEIHDAGAELAEQLRADSL